MRRRELVWLWGIAITVAAEMALGQTSAPRTQGALDASALVDAGGQADSSRATDAATSPARAVRPAAAQAGLDSTQTPREADGGMDPKNERIGFYAAHYDLTYDDYYDCLFPRTLCLDSSGRLFPFEDVPDLRAGDWLKVLVFAKDAAACLDLPDGGGAGASMPDGGTAGVCTFEVEAPALSLTSAAVPKVFSGDIRPMRLVASLLVPSAPAAPGPLQIRIHGYAGADTNRAPVVDAPVSIPIGTPGYYFEPTILFPTVFGGNRSVIVSPLLDGREEVVGVQQSNLGAIENVAVGANIYPFGFPGSCVTGRGFSGVLSGFLSVCSPKQIFRPLTLQVGVSVANNAFRNYYLGAGYSIIRGVALTGGVAFVQGQFLGSSLYSGEVVTIPASGGAIAGIETKYMMQPYFGVSITPSLITLIVNGVEGIKSLAPTQSSNQPADPGPQ